MKKIILLMIVLLFSCCPDTQAEKEKLYAKIATLQEDVRVAEEMITIMSCESGFRHDGIFFDNGKSYGIAQFQYKTFVYLQELSGMKGLEYKKKEDQMRLLRWAIKKHYDKNWTCATRNKKRKAK